MQATEERSRYVDTVEAAKIIRETLKREFPGVRFSVRSDRYSMGSSIDVRWTDGPTVGQVEEITAAFQGKGFDGMIDMAYYKEAWLLPDGTAKFAHTQGTEMSKGTVPERFGSPRHPGAELVHFGCDYVHANRELSPAFRESLEAEIARAARQPFDNNARLAVYVKDGIARPISGSDEYGSQLVWQLASQRPAPASDWVPEWRRPKPKKAPQPRTVYLFMFETQRKEGQRVGGCMTHGRGGRGIGSAYYFTYVKETHTAHLHDWKAPKYVREEIRLAMEWATGADAEVK